MVQKVGSSGKEQGAPAGKRHKREAGSKGGPEHRGKVKQRSNHGPGSPAAQEEEERCPE